jgi:hypothetical protein
MHRKKVSLGSPWQRIGRLELKDSISSRIHQRGLSASHTRTELLNECSRIAGIEGIIVNLVAVRSNGKDS